jgi:glycosyltransferase involved in cell wall biosynthesis
VKNRARISEQEPRTRIRHERTIARRATAIVTASDHERMLLERYYGADPARMHTIPCGVDLGRFKPLDRDASRLRLGLRPGQPVLLWVGRLERLKGVDILISAAAQLDERDFTLLIVGGDERAGGLRRELEAQAKREGIEANVRFISAVPRRSAGSTALPTCGPFTKALPSREAMACGTPVVASRVGGLVSTVTDGVTGYLIPWRCPEPFAEKLEVLLNNPALRANFSRAARRSVERFRWGAVALQVAALYDRATAEYRAGDSREAFGKEVYEAAVLAGGAP